MNKRWKMLLSIVSVVALLGTMMATLPVSAWEGGELPSDLEMAFDYPIRDTMVTYVPATDTKGETIQGGDTYYMVGTSGYPSFWERNEGIRMWKSSDLKTWEPVDAAADYENDGDLGNLVYSLPYGGDEWVQYRGALWAPEVHYIQGHYDDEGTYYPGNYYLVFSMGGGDPDGDQDLSEPDYNGNGILVSTTGKPEGPYVNAIATGGPVFEPYIDGSLFQDDDANKTVYFLCQDGKIAKMKPNMSGLAEQPIQLSVKNGSGLNTEMHVGFEGSQMFKHDGKYYLICADNNADYGAFYTYDSMFAISDTIYGTKETVNGVALNLYGDRDLAVRHGGHNNYFQDRDGNWWCTFFGNDQASIQPEFVLRPAVMRVEFLENGKIRPILGSDEDNNIAIDKDVETGSQESAALAGSYAVDGKFAVGALGNSLWRADNSANALWKTDNDYILVDLGSDCAVMNIRLWFETNTNANPYKFKVETSTDKETWDLYSDAYWTTGTKIAVRMDGELTTARYVKVTFESEQNGSALPAVRELGVYGSEGDMSAEMVANRLKPTTNYTVDAKEIVLPKVPEGFTVELIDSSNQNVVALDGALIHGTTTGVAEVTFKVTKTSDNTTATSKAYTVLVAAERSANLALNKKAEATSEFAASFAAGNAFDGKKDTRWACTWANLNASLTVDLRGYYNVNEVALEMEKATPDKPYQFKLEVSNDGKTWTEFSNQYYSNGSIQGTFNVLGSAEGRYVRLSFVGNTEFPSVWEMEVYGTPVEDAPEIPAISAAEVAEGLAPLTEYDANAKKLVIPTVAEEGFTVELAESSNTSVVAMDGTLTHGTALGTSEVKFRISNGSDSAVTKAYTIKVAAARTNNVALDKNATASSVHGAEYAAKYAVDGNLNTRWATAWEGFASRENWLTVDLGSRHQINEVVLIGELSTDTTPVQQKPYQFKVEVSNDNATWTDFSTYFYNHEAMGGTIGVPGSAVARYVRINFNSASTEFPSLWEVEVYGNPVTVNVAQPTVTATGSTTGNKVTWNKIDGADGYLVYSRSYKDGKWTGWSRISDTTALTYTDTKATMGVYYQYTVRAYNSTSTSTFAASNTVVRLEVPKVTATGSTASNKATWNKVTGAKGYTVYSRYYKNGKWSSWENRGNTTSLSFTDTKATSGLYYQYTVRAYNGTCRSNFVASGNAVRLAQPTVKAVGSTSGNKVTWNKIAGAKGYTVYYRYYKNGKWTGWNRIGNTTALSYTHTKAGYGYSFQYTVKAYNGTSTSSFKASGNAVRLAQPKVTTVKSGSALKSTWTKSTGAKGYIVYRRQYNASTKKWSGWTKMTTTTALSYTDKTTKKGVYYQYTAKAYNGDSQSTFAAGKQIKR